MQCFCLGIHGTSGTEGPEPASTDPTDLQLPRGATGSGSAQTSTTPVTRLIDTRSLLQVTPYHGDKAKFLGWKWSCLIAVRAISKPFYEGFKEIEDNMNQDIRNSRLPKNDLELADQAHTLLALLCKDRACACVRSAEDGNGYQSIMASCLESTNSSECDKPFESVAGTNIHVTRHTHLSSTMEQKC